MRPLTPLVQCIFRLAFAFLLANQSLSALIVPMIAAEASTGATGYQTPIDFTQFVAIHALPIVIAIWIAFGVRTRLVTALGLALYTGYTLATHSPETGAIGLGLFIAFGLALPLIAAGGGSYSIYRKGWSGLADL